MTNLEKQVAALVWLHTAQEEEDRKAAMKELLRLSKNVPGNAGDTQAFARHVLTRIGVPERLVGHSYLFRALVLAAADGRAVKGATKPGGLYDKIAKEFGTTAIRVERGMRHGIEVAWSRCDGDVIAEYFGNTVSPETGKPTTLEFVARLASVVRDM
ncbi:MAG: sporulation initiation factor Spo0A C-terminal domain-containing protein [Oscillospiraceae bacterium]|nr:sporulation initiation factor Spo0A C-terminal domain-containing protein [Oscillospiraceae bacterium]